MSNIVAKLTQLRKIVVFYGRFLPSFSAIGYRWRSLAWPRLRATLGAQTWLVSGASGGVGGAIALEAARRGATVLAAARSKDKLDALVAQFGASRGARDGQGSIVPVVADLALKRDVQQLVRELLAGGRRIDVLVNNVGLMLADFTHTDEGHETSFATNILGHYILTEGLIRGGAMVPGGAVVNMSSGGMYNVPLNVAPMDAKDAKGYNGVRAYALAKRGQAALTEHWTARYGASHDLQFYVMHPGWADTQGVKTAMPRFRRMLQLVLRNPAQGADTAVWLGATRPKGTDPTGFWLDRAPREAHAYEFTRKARNTPAELAVYLQQVSDAA